ncbi:MAG TPA: HlyD family efflux transporter periplasmic adaptor subunit [Thermoanaerobaculia bacterium]|nr:HlyD family efflux transporter periplasmic adaptor subunit [Thermoanaerobaculia bacterium]
MDRELDASFRRRQIWRRVGWTGGSLALVAAVLLLLPGWLRPSLDRDRIRLGTVDRGPVEGIIEASGTVIPAFEGVLSSPVEARVQKILKRPGEVVRAGEEILKLDTSASRLSFERLQDQLSKKANEQLQLRLTLEKQLSDLRGRIESGRLDAEAAEYRAEQNRKLRKDGLVSEQTLRASEVEAKKARIELSQLEQSVRDAKRSTKAQLQGLDLDLAILRKELDEARRQLELATTRSDRSGVLTWVVPQEGATIQRGEVIARIADLDAYRVEATVSDIHASSLRPGLPVRVMLDGKPLVLGSLSQIYPTIENGAVKFTAELDDPRNPELRNKLGVDVLVVTGSRPNALRVPKGAFVQGGVIQKVFVVEGDRAVRRDVRLGVAGYDQYEVLDGLAEGEEIILSDMKDYLHLEQVKLSSTGD